MMAAELATLQIRQTLHMAQDFSPRHECSGGGRAGGARAPCMIALEHVPPGAGPPAHTAREGCVQGEGWWEAPLATWSRALNQETYVEEADWLAGRRVGGAWARCAAKGVGDQRRNEVI
jgi:hypothetical protein